MASLQRITADGRDCWRVRFYVDKRRCTVGLGSFDEAAAMIAKSHIEHLVEQKGRDRLPSVKASRWLDALPVEIHDRLAALGLCEPRRRCELPRTLIAFMRAYIAGRDDWRKPENYKQAVDKLERFLGKDIPLTALTKGDTDRWHRWMIQELGMSPNTAGQNVKRCRQMMRSAIDEGLATENPFLGIRIDLSSDKTKNRFIDESMALAILDACPDQEWRVIFALCRFGGLRCPSEVLRLRWSDINWERQRFKVRSTKTQRYGKGERVVPLFPELGVELEGLFTVAEPGVSCAADSYVIQRYRDVETNLRTTLDRIADRAGVARWPKPFMALRASRRTELERSGQYANHVLNAWFGHTAAIAETHYLQVTEDDFASATSSVVPFVVPFVVPSQGTQKSPQSVSATKNPAKCGALVGTDGHRGDRKYTPEDSNL